MKRFIMFAMLLFFCGNASAYVPCTIYDISALVMVDDTTGTVEVCDAIRLCVADNNATVRITECDFAMPVEPPCQSDGSCGLDPEEPEEVDCSIYEGPYFSPGGPPEECLE